MDAKQRYFHQYFYFQNRAVIELFAGHGRKHSDGENEAFLCKSWKYHVFKAAKHFIAGVFRPIDKDSGYPHWILSILRLYMAIRNRKLLL